MLSQRKQKENELIRTCTNSGDIEIGQHFKGIRFVEDVINKAYYLKTPCVCVGKVGTSQRLLRTEDGKRYVYVADGWGVQDGYLVAIKLGYDFYRKNPMGIQELKEFIANPPAAHGMAANMKLRWDLNAAKEIISILEKNKQ